MFSRFILFKGICLGNKTCEFRLTSLSKLRKAWRNKCWEVLLTTRYLEYFLAAVAIATNFIVVIVTASSKSLRESTAFLLIAQMALCDVFMGVYAAGIARGHRLAGNALLFPQWRRVTCPYFRSIFTIAQFMDVSTCFLVTLERYLAIVFSMRPFVRLEKLPAACLSVLFCVIAGTLCALIQIIDRGQITDNFMCLLIRDFEKSSSLHVSQFVLLITTVWYLIIIAMYLHIYIYVKKSRKDTGVQGHRDSKLARIIGLVILSNVVFFVIPNLTIIVMTIGSFYFRTSAAANSTVRRWLPPMCLVFNSCINPFLFAFRNDKFQAALRSIFFRYVGMLNNLKAKVRQK
ncbi:hypothetical protein QZH41_006411 [Actinostola sp. cb2023]|nr:hypothetical protein QZH41_006411 [Actinostola sp. cb2023]